ncbi:MAG TPA: hypothetical protein VFJ16_22865 [Longimicrobium sp.]|nr:hypothetical protein [Longimicrobium sp.]
MRLPFYVLCGAATGLAALLLAGVGCARQASRRPSPAATPVAAALTAVAAGGEIPADLVVTYDDMHGLWGGTTITLSGNGDYRLDEMNPSARQHRSLRGRVPEADVRALAALLAEAEVWRQVTPPRMPVPDESRAYLRVRAAGGEVTIWEWYNEMPRNGRISRVRDRMSTLGRNFPDALAPPAPPG